MTWLLLGEAKTNELEAEVSLPTKLQLTLPADELLLELEFKLELSCCKLGVDRLRRELRRLSMAVAWQCFNILISSTH